MHVNNLAALCLMPAVLGQAFIQQKLENGEPSGTVFGEAGANQTFDYV